MNLHRLLISFTAGTIVVLAMLVAGLKLFNGRSAASGPVADDFTVEYLTPEQASRLLRQGEQPDGRPAATDATGSPQTDSD